MKRKFKLLFKLLEEHTTLTAIVLMLMVATAIFESLGLGALLPAMELATESNTQSKFSILLNPFLELFPSNYRMSAIIGVVLMLTTLKATSHILLIKYEVEWRSSLSASWLKKMLFNYLQLDYRQFVGLKHGEMLNNIYSESAKSGQFFHDIAEIFSRSCVAIGLFLILLITNWKATFFGSIIMLILYLFTHRSSGSFSARLGEERIAIYQDLYSIGSEALSGLRQVRTFGLEKQHESMVGVKLKRYVKACVHSQLVSDLPSPIGEFLVLLLVALGILYIDYSQRFTYREIIPVIGVYVLAMRPLMSNVSALASLRMRIISNLPSMTLVKNLIQDSGQLEDVSKGTQFESLKENIIFENVSFRHESNTALFDKLNWTIHKGKVTALIGPSGVGKSTLLDLILGLYRPQSGQILVNGVNLSNLSMESWRKHLGYVSQDSFLFHLSIEENIRISRPTATYEEVVAASKRAFIHDFIETLPEGYQTIMTDRGSSLSGGQRQRVAIARAIIRNPELYILDEATSALDAQSEESISDTILQLKNEGKTILLITHRQTLLNNADFVFKLEAGGKILHV